MPGRLSRADTSWRFYRAIAPGRRQYRRAAALAQPVTVAFVLMLVGARAFPEAALVRARSDVQRRATIIALPGDENDPDGSAAIASAQRPTFSPGLSTWSNVMDQQSAEMPPATCAASAVESGEALRALGLDGLAFMSAAQAVAVFGWVERELAQEPSFKGLRAEPRAVFADGTASSADINDDHAYAIAELITAVPLLFHASDLKLCAARLPSNNDRAMPLPDTEPRLPSRAGFTAASSPPFMRA